MTKLLRACLVMLAACGRVNFDLADPCPVQVHDEDGDGVDDTCDVCPHVGDNQRDTDGDGVGDACDPTPQPTEQLVFFDPFTAERSEWMFVGPYWFANDVLHVPGASGVTVQQRLVAPPGHDLYELAGEVGTAGVLDRQLAIELVGNVVTENLYCEIYEASDRTYASITYYDGTFHPRGSQTLQSPLSNGTARMRFRVTPSLATCDVEWAGQAAQIVGDVPPGFVTTLAFIQQRRLDFDLRWFAQIRTLP